MKNMVIVSGLILIILGTLLIMYPGLFTYDQWNEPRLYMGGFVILIVGGVIELIGFIATKPWKS
mgnify:CR=1 FL=1|jgi:hypothetical protein